jgi:EmrB/QacA subfamily drug resistance transporter
VLLVVGGRLGDIFGRRRIFLFGVTVFALSSAAIGLAPTDAALIAGRAVQGVGAAMMMPTTLSIVSNAFPPHERGKALGTWAGVSALALALGPVLGGFLTESVSWRAIFFLNIPVAIGAIAVTLFSTHESRDETVGRRLDYAGIVTLTGGLTALVVALIEANRWHWGSPRTVGLLAFSLVALVAFVAIELRVRAPMVDFSFFRSRSFLGACLVAFVVTFSMMAMFFFLALYMQNVLGFSPLEAGVRFLPSTLVLIVMGPTAGRLADRIGSRPLIVVGLMLSASSLLWESFMTIHTTYLDLMPAFVLLGLGIGMTMSPMTTAAMNAVDRTKAGVASGVLSMSRMVGGTFGVAVLGAIVAAIGRAKIDDLLPALPAAARQRLTDSLGAGGVGSGHAPAQIVAATHEAFVTALGTGLKLGGSVALLGALLAWALIRSPRPQAPVETAPAREPVPALAHEPVSA